MIFFHGTAEEYLKDIKKNGLRSITSDQWLMEITKQKFCCIAPKPNTGEGGSPSYFAVQNARKRNSNGYLVVLDIAIPDTFENTNDEKILAVFDNKILDDYVRFHFFVRDEFRKVGFSLYSLFEKKKERFIPNIQKRKAKESDSVIFSPIDQRGYYKDLRKDKQRYVYNISGVELSDDCYDALVHIGIGKPLYYFLKMHFQNTSKEKYQELDQTHSQNEDFWRAFYQNFPCKIEEKKWKYMNQWFSPEWLQQRKLKKVIRNSQLLIRSVSPEKIVGFIQIASPSGFTKKFRPSKSKGASFSQMVWREVFQMQDK